MSYTTLYVLNKKSVTSHKRYRNSWGSAALLWDYLSIKYLGLKGMPLGYGADYQPLWDLANDSRLSEDEVIAHRMTFDWEYVPLDKLQLAADSCRLVFSKTLSFLDSGRANHWYDIGDDIERLTEIKLNRHARGVCLGCTSVSDPWWQKKKIPEAVSIFH